MRCHPTRWLWGLIPIAMLSWLAVHAKSDLIERDLEQRSRVALAAAGHDWASVVFSGREGLLVGHLASARQRDDAAALVRDVWGVRTVETRVALSPAGASLPVAPVAAEIAPRGLNVVAPGSIGAAAATELARGAPDIGHAALDQAPAMTVRARDQGGPPSPEAASAAPLPEQKPVVTVNVPAEVEASPPAAALAAPLPEQKPAVAVNVPAEVEASPPAAALAAPLPEQKPAVAVNVPVDVQASPAAAAPAAPLPEQKPTVAAGAPSLAVTALPASGQSAPVPERKPALPASLPTVAEAVQRAAGPAAPPPEKKPVEAAPTAPQAEVRAPVTAPAPPLPQRAPRFETAALPQGNIAAEDDCIEQVRQAAKRVEVHFAHGGAKLDMAGKALIDGLIGTLHGCPGTALHVAGHSDASGHPGRNLTLSKHRARAVASYMIHKGIDAGRLVAIGYGDTKPVAPNDTRENRAKNRRIEVAITARAAPLPPLPVRKQGTDNGLSRR